MSKIDELEQNEINEINNQIDELYDLETLIMEGADVRIPVELTYPSYDEKQGKIIQKKFGVKLAPLTSNEANNALRLAKRKQSNFQVELLKKGLYKMNDEPFPPKLIEKMHMGIVTALGDKLAEISGVQVNQEDKNEFVDDLMGF